MGGRRVVRKRTLPLLLLLGLAYASYRLPEWSASWLEAGIERALGRDVSVDGVRFGLLPIEAEISGLRVAGPTADAAPFLEIERVLITPSLAPRFDGRVVLTRVELLRPLVRINAWSRGGDDIPRPGRGAGGGVEVRLRRLQVVDGALLVNHERVPLHADLPEFEGRLLARRGGAMSGRLSFKPGTLQVGALPELPIGTELEVDVDGSEIDVRSAHLRARDTDLAYRGHVRLRGDPTADLRVTGRVDLGLLDRHVVRTGLRLEGAGRFAGRVVLDRGQLRVAGDLRGDAGSFDGTPVPEFRARVERDGRGVRIHELEARLLDGAGRFDVDVASQGGPVRVRAALQAVDLEGALRVIFDYGPMALAAAATGDVDVSWPRGRARQFSGRVALDLAPRADERTPLAGRFELEAEGGRARLGRVDLRSPELVARLDGTIEADDRADMGLDGESGDLERADALLVRLRRALGNTASVTGVGGSGRFRGRWRGRLDDPLLEGRFSGDGVRYLGVDWGRAEWAGSLDASEIRSHSLVLRKGGGELWLDGRTETGSLGAGDGIEAQLRLRDWPAADLVRAMEWQLPLEGPLSGQALLRGRRSAPFGEARFTAATGRYFGVPFTELEVRSDLEGSVTRVSLGRATVGGGRVLFRGSVTRDDVYDGLAEIEAVALDGLPLAGVATPLGGRVSGELRLGGRLETPRLEARLQSPRLFLGDEGLGALDLQLRGSGDGRIAIETQLRSPRLDLRGAGELGAAPPHSGELSLEASATSVDPYLRVLAPALPAAAGIVLSGHARVWGDFAQPERLDAEALLSEIELQLPDYPVTSAEPLLIDVKDGRATLSELRLVGEGTSLSLNGWLGVARDAPIELAIRGDADLQALSAVTRRVRGRGAARLVLGVAGSRAAPRVDGRLEVEGAGLRVRGFPQGIDDLHGALRFDQDAAVFEGVSGRFGGGPVGLEGRVDYAEGRLRSFDIRAGGQGLSLRYPDGLRATFDGDVRFYGDAQAQWLAGAIDVRQARWTRRYDVASELLAAATPRQAAPLLRSGLRYDLQLRAPGTLSVDNNLASLEARADLRLGGSYEAPVLLGRAEIDRGRVYFQGTTYVIRRGTVDFTNPQAIDPVFNLEAEARVRSYRVTLKMNGTLERVFPTLTSDPPLSAVQILNLLAGADESAVASLQASQLDTSRLAATGAATLAAGRLSEEVGLERGAEKLLGLNRFSIDPSLVRGGISDPTARLTVGKRVRDLSVLWSVDLRGTDERLLSVEYTLSDRLSILFTQAVPGGVGLDVRLRQSR